MLCSAINTIDDHQHLDILQLDSMQFLFMLFPAQHYDCIHINEYFDDTMLREEMCIKTEEPDPLQPSGMGADTGHYALAGLVQQDVRHQLNDRGVYAARQHVGSALAVARADGKRVDDAPADAQIGAQGRDSI